VKPWPHKKKARRLADRKRQRVNREKRRLAAARAANPTDLPDQAIKDLLGPSIPKDIKQSFVRQILRHRQMIGKRRAVYAQRRRLSWVPDADCINSFVLDVTTGQRACYCIGRGCPRIDRA
jgi:hypothetical protein